MEQSRLMSSPFGDLNSIPGIEPNRLVYVYEYDWEEEGWKPPSSWFVRDSTGGRMYAKARDRKKAQEIIDTFYSKGKYTVISDKVIAGR